MIFLVWAVPDFRDPTFSKNQYDQLQAAAPSDYQHDNQNTHFWIREFYGWVYAEDSLAQWIMSLVAVAATIVSLLALVWLRATWAEAKRTGDTAHANLAFAREIGVAQTRSYVSIVGGGYILNRAGYSGWVDVVNKGLSPAIDVEIEFSIRLENAWFGGALMGSQPPPFDVAPHVAKKSKIQPGEVSRFYFVWTQEQFGERFPSLEDERFTVVITCNLKSKTIYPNVRDSGKWQVTNYPGFVRTTEKSLVAKGDLYPRQLQGS